MEYHVKWEIEVEADSPLEAARKAREIQLNPESTATVFDVVPHHPLTRIDLDEIDHPDEGDA